MYIHTKKFLAVIAVIVLPFSFAHAQMTGANMMNNTSPQGSAADVTTTAAPTAQAAEESQGQVLYQKLQDKQASCTDLKDSDFELIGEFVMGQNTGAGHAAMNEHIKAMMGADKEEAIHTAIGKSASGCDTAPPLVNKGWGVMPMMGNYGYGGINNIHSIAMFIFWIIVLVGIGYFVLSVMQGDRSGTGGRSALDILNERYARSEIDKAEYEEKKKHITSRQ